MEKRKTILVVEDEESLLSTLRDELEAGGFAVDPTTNGAEALRKIEENPPDLVLLDILLPDMNGLGVLSNLKASERTRAIPVVILSNVGDEEKVQEALDLGADAYLVKTQYDLKDVLDMLRTILTTGPPGRG